MDNTARTKLKTTPAMPLGELPSSHKHDAAPFENVVDGKCDQGRDSMCQDLDVSRLWDDAEFETSLCRATQVCEADDADDWLMDDIDD